MHYIMFASRKDLFFPATETQELNKAPSTLPTPSSGRFPSVAWLAICHINDHFLSTHTSADVASSPQIPFIITPPADEAVTQLPLTIF
jgi:hypothetical protein